MNSPAACSDYADIDQDHLPVRKDRTNHFASLSVTCHIIALNRNAVIRDVEIDVVPTKSLHSLLRRKPLLQTLCQTENITNFLKTNSTYCARMRSW